MNIPITLRKVNVNNYPVLKDFESLWNKIEQDNNLITGRNYPNHTATWYGPVDYGYTGIRHKAQPLPVEFTKIANRLDDYLKYPKEYFNCLLINAYINKGIAPHADNESIFICKDKTIGAVATISIGASALVTITHNDHSKELLFEASDASLYVMPDGNFQNEYKHSVSASSGKRISLTFRHIP